MSSLTNDFKSIINLYWTEFVEIEKNKKASIDDEAICALVRMCTDTDNISASKMSFDRIDGLQEVPIEVKVPKFYIRYVNAKSKKSSSAKQLNKGAEKEEPKKNDYNAATAGLRATLVEMRGMPKAIVPAVLKVKRQIDDGKPVKGNIPRVKHVIVANLLKNVRRGSYKAIELVFDQIDGKLTKTITLLGGNDVYIDDEFTKEAPENATIDENGYYIAENATMTSQWMRGFAQSKKGLEILAEGLENEN